MFFKLECGEGSRNEDKTGEKENIKKMLLSYRDYYGNYHNHKENMAWVATVFYVGVIGGLLKLVRDSNSLFKNSAYIAAAVFFILILTFVWQQLKNRYVAHCIVCACSIWIVKLTDPDFGFSEDDLKICDKNIFPQFLQKEIDAQKGTQKDIDLSIRIFECTKYGIILLTTAIALHILCS